MWKILLAQGVAFGVVVGGLSGVGFGSAGIGAGWSYFHSFRFVPASFLLASGFG